MPADRPAAVLLVEDDEGIAELERGRLEDTTLAKSPIPLATDVEGAASVGRYHGPLLRRLSRRPRSRR